MGNVHRRPDIETQIETAISEHVSEAVNARVAAASSVTDLNGEPDAELEKRASQADVRLAILQAARENDSRARKRANRYLATRKRLKTAEQRLVQIDVQNVEAQDRYERRRAKAEARIAALRREMDEGQF